VIRSAVVAGLVSAAFVVGSTGAAEKSAVESYSFGSLKSATVETAKSQALEWLAASGRSDDATRKQFDAIWGAEGNLHDKIVATLSLDPAAAKLLKDANDPTTPAPTEVPALIRDAKQHSFFRANLALAFAKAISSKRVYEEALEALGAVRPEQVADPGAYYFHKAVAEHSLIKKEAASQSILRLLDDVSDAPDRYKMVGALMLFDMQQWKADEKDLANIAKLMDNSGRRLDLARAGNKTQDIQKKIVFRLDEVIKELENQAKSGGT